MGNRGMNVEKGTVYWLTGLSGSGKTTLGTALYEHLRRKKPNVMIMDGDHVRHAITRSGYDKASRLANAVQYQNICKFVVEQGIDVVCPTIAMYNECYDSNRAAFEKYVMIYVRVPLEELVKRDPKGLYRKALSGEMPNVMGVDMPFDPVKDPDLVIDNYGETTKERAIKALLDFVDGRAAQ